MFVAGGGGGGNHEGVQMEEVEVEAEADRGAGALQPAGMVGCPRHCCAPCERAKYGCSHKRNKRTEWHVRCDRCK
jgi:hypothetical protein